jgi:hypothetical protein
MRTSPSQRQETSRGSDDGEKNEHRMARTGRRPVVGSSHPWHPAATRTQENCSLSAQTRIKKDRETAPVAKNPRNQENQEEQNNQEAIREEMYLSMGGGGGVWPEWNPRKSKKDREVPRTKKQVLGWVGLYIYVCVCSYKIKREGNSWVCINQ